MTRPATEEFPLRIDAATGASNALAWVRDRAAALDAELTQHGAILVRGLAIDSDAQFTALMAALYPVRLDYEFQSTPRTSLGDRVFTATEYPARFRIAMHNEASYNADWPTRVAFGCLVAAPSGGATTLADNRRVTTRIAPHLRDELRAHGVRYVRNYFPKIDIPWQKVFNTTERQDVEAFCRQHDIECAWLDNEQLRTSQVRQGLARHPLTGEELWFNQAHIYHYSALDPVTRKMLLRTGEANLPRNAYRGDGAAFTEESLATVRAAYEAESVEFEWQQGDVLLLDNMLAAHGRAPFEGPRRILVSMAAPYSQVAKQ